MENSVGKFKAQKKRKIKTKRNSPVFFFLFPLFFNITSLEILFRKRIPALPNIPTGKFLTFAITQNLFKGIRSVNFKKIPR